MSPPRRPLPLVGAFLALAALALLAWPDGSPARAQADDPPAPIDDLRHWQTLASGDEIIALAVDRREPNRLWAGTEGGGLVAWDLSTGAFRQHLRPQEPGLPSNRVQDLAVGRLRGELWLATDRGVARLAGGSWQSWGEADGLPDEDLRAIAVAPNGTIWAGSRADGVAVFDARSGGWLAYPPVAYDEYEDGPFEGPGFGAVSDIAIRPDGSVWVAHGRRGGEERPALSVFDPAVDGWWHIKAAGPRGNPTRFPASDQILALDVDEEGTLWVGTWTVGLLSYDGEDWSWPREKHPLCRETVSALHAVPGAVFAACSDGHTGSAARWDGASWTEWAAAEAPRYYRSLVVTGDRLLLGTNGPGPGGEGILSFDARGKANGVLRTGGTTLPVNDLTRVAFAPDGTLWAGTRGLGLVEHDGERWRVHTRASTSGDLAGDTITDLAFRGDELWIASTKTRFQHPVWTDGGVSVYDTAAQRWRQPYRFEGESGGLPDNDVGSLSVAPDGRVWIGLGLPAGGPGAEGTTNNGEGVAVLDPERERWTHYRYADTGQGLSGDTVADLVATADGAWVATSYHPDPVLERRAGGGVSRLSGGAWRAWTGGQDGLRSFHGSGRPTDRDPWITGDVRSLHLAADGTPWAGTFDLEDGILATTWPYVDAVVNHFDGARWEAWSFPRQGWVSAIQDDGTGRLWVGTTRGHERSEFDVVGAEMRDEARGGLRIRAAGGGAWHAVLPENSGLAARSVTDLAMEPGTGRVFVALENGGLSVFRELLPTPTPSASPTPTREATPTPRSTATATPTDGTATSPRPSATPSATPTRSPTGRHRLFLPRLSSGRE